MRGLEISWPVPMRPAPCSHLIRAALIGKMLGRLEGDAVASPPQEAEGGDPPPPQQAKRRKRSVGHVPLMQRTLEPGVEERVARLAAGRAAAGVKGLGEGGGRRGASAMVAGLEEGQVGELEAGVPGGAMAARQVQQQQKQQPDGDSLIL
jgi:hypothetical protein